MAVTLAGTAVARLPGRLPLRVAALVAVLVATAWLHGRWIHRTLCPWRAATGLPCPFCGGTTAAAALGHGHLLSALRASPLGVGLLGAWPLAGRLPHPSWWHRPLPRIVAVSVVLVAAEVWQLARFGLLSA